jgi:P-type conjugative transfer protein TrbJ
MSARRRMLIALVFVCSLGSGSNAGAGSLTGGWTEGTQKSNLVIWLGEGVAQAKKITELVQLGVHLYTKLSDMEEQARNLLPIDWRAFVSYVDQLEQVISQGKALSFGSIASEQQFQQQFNSYARFLEDVKQYESSYFTQRYRAWNQSLRDSLQATLQVNHLTFEKIKNDEARMHLIQERMQNATTRNELLRASTDIALVTVDQFRRLVAIQMQHSQVHMQFMAYRNNKTQVSRLRKRAFLIEGERPTLGDGDQW